MTSSSTVNPTTSTAPSPTPSSALEQSGKFQLETPKPERPPIRRARILNSFFDIVTTPDTVEWIVQQIKTNQRSYICTVNVAILMMMRSLPCLAQFASKAGLIVADGQPIIWASHWLKNPLPERVTGIDLISAIAERAQTEGFSIYCLGANPATIEQAVANLKAQYPKLTIHFADGYFSDAQAGDRVAVIRNSGAHILFVGMGVPKQEDFLAEHWDALGVNVAIGVGGSFNVIAGVQHRAPEWVQELGLEWFYRLMQEPQRLWKRYLTTGSQFAIALTKQLLVTRFVNRPSTAK
jgi:N-acetylglucosaminyldiphosphoundecaprenol N-acetyl-beta-D-mannosaminyltransferase